MCVCCVYSVVCVCSVCDLISVRGHSYLVAYVSVMILSTLYIFVITYSVHGLDLQYDATLLE